MKRDKEEGLFESMAPWGGRGGQGEEGRIHGWRGYRSDHFDQLVN